MLSRDARIMIVDDSRLVRMAMTRLFGSLGYHNLIEATDGNEAIAMHAAHRPDLIVLDVVMPNMRGDDALEQIRLTDSTTPVIMLSSVAQHAEIDKCRSLGITEFLLKPLGAATGRGVMEQQLARL